jgi:Holliday junction DNA helicase RuvA
VAEPLPIAFDPCDSSGYRHALTSHPMAPMIAYLEGTILARLPDAVVLLTTGGVGYAVRLPAPLLLTAPEPGLHPVRYFVSTVVRETEITLYGFDAADGKLLFELLTTVSGIGPKLALAVLSAFSPAQAVSAIVSQDVARLSSVPGVGRKTATRLCLELTEKLAKGPIAAAQQPQGPPGGQGELLSALTNLGFPEKDVLAALRRLQPGGLSFPEQLKQALALLGRT